jgi:hypothetical protein
MSPPVERTRTMPPAGADGLLQRGIQPFLSVFKR